jgi:hypothetical protein
MARANRSSSKKSRKKTRVSTSRTKRTRKKKTAAAASQQPQAENVPYVPDNQSWDSAAQLIAQHRRGLTAAIRAQPDMSPVFSGNTAPPQVIEAAGTTPEAGTAPGGIGASINAAAGAAAGTGETAGFAGDSSLTADATVVRPYDQMLARLGEVETTLQQLRPLLPSSTVGIGHNNPPPLNQADLDEIKADIALLKTQPPPTPAEANKTASKLLRVGERVLDWVGKQLDTFATEFMKAAGKTAGTAVGLSPLWLTFGDQLTGAASAIMQWVLALLGR